MTSQPATGLTPGAQTAAHDRRSANLPTDIGPVDAGRADTTPAAAARADTMPADAGRADTLPADAGRADARPADAAQADTKPADAAQAETKPADAAQAETTPADAAQAETTPADAAQAETTPARADPLPSDTVQAETARAHPGLATPRGTAGVTGGEAAIMRAGATGAEATVIRTTNPPVGTGPTSTPLAGDSPAERHQLPRRVTRYWRWRVFFGALPLLLLLMSLAIVIPWGAWWLRWGIVGIVFALIVVGMIFAPPIRYRVFWYAISPTEIDIQHGIIFIKRSVVPMHRVQNLRTERGPMADHYQMTNLKIRTAAGSVTISGLDRLEANELCDRISRLSDVADDV